MWRALIRFVALFVFTIKFMETKRVQATDLAPPAMYQAQMRGFNMLADISALGLPYQATGVAKTRKFIRERTDVVRRYIKAHVEAVHRFKTDRETSMKVLAKTLAISDKQLFERTYDGAIAEHKLPAKQYPTLEGLKTIMASDTKAKGAKAEEFVDLRFIKELDDSDYFDKLYKNSQSKRNFHEGTDHRRSSNGQPYSCQRRCARWARPRKRAPSQ